MEIRSIIVYLYYAQWCKLRTIPIRLSQFPNAADLLSCNRSAFHSMPPLLWSPQCFSLRFHCKWVSQEGQWFSLSPRFPPGFSALGQRQMQLSYIDLNVWILFTSCLLSDVLGFPSACSNPLQPLEQWRHLMYFSVICTLWLCIVLCAFGARLPQMDNKDLILSLKQGLMPSYAVTVLKRRLEMLCYDQKDANRNIFKKADMNRNTLLRGMVVWGQNTTPETWAQLRLPAICFQMDSRWGIMPRCNSIGSHWLIRVQGTSSPTSMAGERIDCEEAHGYLCPCQDSN